MWSAQRRKVEEGKLMVAFCSLRNIFMHTLQLAAKETKRIRTSIMTASFVHSKIKYDDEREKETCNEVEEFRSVIEPKFFEQSS